MPVDKVEFRRALGHFAAGVTVVTSKIDDGEVAGMTVTAFSSLSLDPPLVLVCIDQRARMHDRLPVGGNFAVNILSQDQESVSRHFASSDPDPFHKIGYAEGATGAPLIEGVIAAVECRVVQRFPGGDHTIVVGQVENLWVHEGQPLVHFRGGYGQLA
jgi:flavin reductase (DIM6/NTAB) family NADH-FMN oxidoreductase RutF